jgi:hypothetical protein
MSSEGTAVSVGLRMVKRYRVNNSLPLFYWRSLNVVMMLANWTRQASEGSEAWTGAYSAVIC